jgi:hypothetical protein
MKELLKLIGALIKKTVKAFKDKVVYKLSKHIKKKLGK